MGRWLIVLFFRFGECWRVGGGGGDWLFGCLVGLVGYPVAGVFGAFSVLEGLIERLGVERVDESPSPSRYWILDRARIPGSVYRSTDRFKIIKLQNYILRAGH
jgi:hypothetical protein